MVSVAAGHFFCRICICQPSVGLPRGEASSPILLRSIPSTQQSVSLYHQRRDDQINACPRNVAPLPLSPLFRPQAAWTVWTARRSMPRSDQPPASSFRVSPLSLVASVGMPRGMVHHQPVTVGPVVSRVGPLIDIFRWGSARRSKGWWLNQNGGWTPSGGMGATVQYTQ